MSTFCYPYKRGTGWRSQGFRSGKGSPYNAPGGHTGFDQAMPAGTPIYAPGDGIIRNSGWLTDNYMANDWWLTRMGGDTLVIDCTDDFGRSETMPTFVIAHLQDSIAKVGQRVKKGQLIGISGTSGTATTGAHAHIEALRRGWDWNNGVYGRVDPELYFTEYPDDLNTITVQGEATAPQPAPPKESEVPLHKRVTVPTNHRRLAKGQAWFLKDKTGKVNENYAVHGAGSYDIDLFVQGTGLPTGETITVNFVLVTGTKRSGYYSQEIHGSADGSYRGRARFKMPIGGGSRVEASVTTGIGVHRPVRRRHLRMEGGLIVDQFLELNNPGLWALAVGFFSPPIISIIQQSRWSPRAKSLVAFAFYLFVAAVTAWIAGLFNAADLVRLVLLIFLAAATSYKALWKTTGVSPAIEKATSPKQDDEPKHSA